MRRVIVLRPEPGASATLARARALGLNAEAHPLFAIEPVAWTMPDGIFDGLLLTSANAVRHAGTLPALPVYAVGDATAEVARKAGADVVSVGSGGVDELLGSLPGSLHLLHLAGEDRKEPVAPAPKLTAITVYRAAPLPAPAAELFDRSVLLVHSPAAGRRVAEIVPDKAAVRVAAISPAAAQACGPGWHVVRAAEAPTDAALLPLAAELCKD